ncbi:hypothetical protein Smic_50460 [Streptomyces microflavus]|uniref:Uncharacterized protein n=1 Tax=Streptomyces microflavus TaxID=1919 RepID=A0A7J0CVC0_STRMI|nr:hypothetical protein Smic_50460 [Streptomyces microflavus]
MYVVAGDQAAEAVPDDVYLALPGAGTNLLHVPAEQLGGGAQVAGERRVVEGCQVATAVPGQGAAQQDEDGTVVDEPVEEDDGAFGGGEPGRGLGRVPGGVPGGGPGVRRSWVRPKG